jgi:diadenosine tetraphosphate (Ap4A) HIT family hydrolase
MRSYDRDSSCGLCASLETATPLYADDLWHIRPIDPPWAIAGWMLLISRRHCPGPAHFDDDEARAFGPALRHFERTLERVTGAQRIYTAALGESQKHLHVHMVPRYARMPKDAVGWGVFDLQRAAAAGEVPLVDAQEAARVHAAYADALRR